MAKFVEVKNENSNATAQVPEKALKVYEAKGWKKVSEKSEDKPVTEQSQQAPVRR